MPEIIAFSEIQYKHVISSTIVLFSVYLIIYFLNIAQLISVTNPKADFSIKNPKADFSSSKEQTLRRELHKRRDTLLVVSLLL
jgi:hypothetical protein